MTHPHCQLGEYDSCGEENLESQGGEYVGSMGELVTVSCSHASCVWGNDSCGERGEEEAEPADGRG